MQYLKSGTSLETQYIDIIKELLMYGIKRNVRNFETIEFSPFVFSTDNPLRNILTNENRKINRAFSIAEFLWIMSGRNDLEMINFYNKNISNFSNNGQILDGAYGPKIHQQLKYVEQCFFNDQNTRQAIVTIWERNPSQSKDIPCTISMQFLNNNGYLDMIVNMRSNDIWLGFPYDFYNFTMIQNYMSFKLGLNIGKYTHIAGSLHLYSTHFDKAKKIKNDIVRIKDIKETEKINIDQLNELFLFEKKLREKEYNYCLNEINNFKEPWFSMAETLFGYIQKK